jgi:ATP-dependent Clp protease ATP-binding subunit ClpA
MSNARYSQHARRALVHARLLAQKFYHPEIDTDHLLLGIWRTEGSLGGRVLHDFEIDHKEAEASISRLHPHVDEAVPHHAASLRAALDVAADESRWLGHHYIGTEHLLLGLLRAGTGQAPTLLADLYLNGSQIRNRVRRLLNEGVSEINLEAVRRLARLSELSRRVLNAAQKLAADYQHPAAGLEHLLIVLGRERRSVATRLLAECGFNEIRLTDDLLGLIVDARLAATALDEVLDSAVNRAEVLGMHYTGTDHILLAMMLDIQAIDLLQRYGVDVECLQSRLTEILSTKR